MFPVSTRDGQSLQATDPNAETLARHGYGVISGGEVSIYSGTLGTEEATVEVAASTLFVDGSVVDVASTTLAIESPDTDPRKDLIVYDPAQTAGNRLVVLNGIPESTDPPSAIRQQAEAPSPPSLSGAVDALTSDTSEPVVPLAEIWIPDDTTAITTDDIFDCRQSVALTVSDVDATNRIGIPVYTADTDAPAETVYFNSGGGQTKYKDGSGTVHNAADGGDAATLDSMDSTEFAALAENETVTGAWTVEQEVSGTIERATKSFGKAVNAGHSDFTTVQDAINFANTNGYHTVDVPPGNYGHVNLPDYMTLLGPGPRDPSSGAAAYFDGGTSTGISMGMNTIVEGISVGSDGDDAIAAGSANDCRIRNCWIQKCGGSNNGIWTNGKWNIVTNCTSIVANMGLYSLSFAPASESCLAIDNTSFTTESSGTNNLLTDNR